MALRFNPPPGWPLPPEGFTPQPGWQPDPSWPAPPPGWQLWVSDGPAETWAAPDARSAETWAAPGARSAETWAAPGGGAQAGPGQGPAGWPAQPPASSWAAPAPGAYQPGPVPGGYQPGGYQGTPPPGPAAGPVAGPPPWPQPGQRGFGYGPPGPPGPRLNGLAVASFILSLPGFLVVTLLLSIVFGIVALAQGSRRQQRGRGLAIAGLVISGGWVLLLILGAALSAAGQPQPSAAPGHARGHASASAAATASATGPGPGTNVFALRVGDCFQNPSGALAQLGVSYVTTVPCSRPHNAQVFAELRAHGTAYPGHQALLRQAGNGCQARITGAVNHKKITADMTVQYLYPLAGSWLTGNRTIVCFIAAAPPPLTGSLLAPHAAG
ncbi:MAG: DUF4190 domain-containing protein [Gemmatimonadota bacterium]